MILLLSQKSESVARCKYYLPHQPPSLCPPQTVESSKRKKVPALPCNFLLPSPCNFITFFHENLFRASKSRLRLHSSSISHFPHEIISRCTPEITNPLSCTHFSSEKFEDFLWKLHSESCFLLKVLSLEIRSDCCLEAYRMEPWKPVPDTPEIWCDSLGIRIGTLRQIFLKHAAEISGNTQRKLPKATSL